MATIQSVISIVDNVKPNIFDNATKTMWLNEVEGMVQTEVMLLAIDDIQQYEYSAAVTDNIYFPDAKTMMLSKRAGLAAGGKVKLSGFVTYSGNNSATNRTIRKVSSDGLTLTFDDNSFPSTGTTPESGTITYDGSSTELLVKAPHDKLYWAYLSAMVDFALGEYTKYSNSMTMFNARFSEFEQWFAQRYHPADMRCIEDGYYISAYGIAVKHGFQGTEEEWLDSLKGSGTDNNAVHYTAESKTEQQKAQARANILAMKTPSTAKTSAMTQAVGVDSSGELWTKPSGSANILDGSQTGSVRTSGSKEEDSEYTIGSYAFAEGDASKASGESSHAEGCGCIASGRFSHAECYISLASGDYSHAEGFRTDASGACSHAEGIQATASGNTSHAEGSATASGHTSHAEGVSTASGERSHAEGMSFASGNYSHAEGRSTRASGEYSHAEGQYTRAYGSYSHAQGAYNVADNNFLDVVGNGNGDSNRSNASALDYNGNLRLMGQVYVGCNADSTGGTQLGTGGGGEPNEYLKSAAVSGRTLTLTKKDNSTVTFNDTGSVVSGAHNGTNWQSITIDGTTKNIPGGGGGASNVLDGSQDGSVRTSGAAEEDSDYSIGMYAFSEGENTFAEGLASHAEGCGASSIGDYSHAEGFSVEASGSYSHAEGYGTFAYEDGDHAEGRNCQAAGGYSHAEGYGSRAFGYISHAEGNGTETNGNGTHSEGLQTKAVGMFQHVQGKFNRVDHDATAYSESRTYAVDDYVIYESSLYKCIVAVTTPEEFDEEKWEDADNIYADIVGNGDGANQRSNASALDWNGNLRLHGEVYANCNDDSSGGVMLQKSTDNSLSTTAKTIVGAINELKAMLDSLMSNQ